MVHIILVLMIISCWKLLIGDFESFTYIVIAMMIIERIIMTSTLYLRGKNMNDLLITLVGIRALHRLYVIAIIIILAMNELYISSNA